MFFPTTPSLDLPAPAFGASVPTAADGTSGAAQPSLFAPLPPPDLFASSQVPAATLTPPGQLTAAASPPSGLFSDVRPPPGPFGSQPSDSSGLFSEVRPPPGPFDSQPSDSSGLFSEVRPPPGPFGSQPSDSSGLFSEVRPPP